MAPLSNEEVATAYMDAHKRQDNEAMGALRAPEWYEDWPQSGERVRGHANDVAILSNWPGGTPAPGDAHLVGSEDRWVLTPNWTYQRIVGSGEMWFFDALAKYPDGSTWFALGLLVVRDGKVRRETWWFGPSLPAPEWRARWVERIDPMESSHGR